MDSNTSKPQRWLILINVSLSVFMSTLDSSIVNIALPVISKDFSVSISSAQWVVTSYLLAISALLLIWGKISDTFGRKKIFAFGFIIFTLGSGMCGLSRNLAMLVLSRILQAFGASSMMALSQGIVTSIFPGNERGRALGITGTTVAIGSLVGPGLGGILTHVAGWQSIFFINVPIGIIGTILTFAIIPEVYEKPASNGFDIKGAVLFIASIILLFTGLLFMQEGILALPVLILMLLLSAAAIYFFIRLEKRVANPLIDLDMFKNNVFTAGIAAAFLSFVAMFSTTLFVPFYLQYVLALDTFKAGLLISFYPAASAVVAPISGWLSDKISYRPLTVAGLLINTVVLAVFAAVGRTASYMGIAVLMALLGAAGAIFQSPNNSSVMGSVPRNRLGVAGGINALFRNLGMISGATLSVILFTYATKMNINSMTVNNPPFGVELFARGFRVVLIFAALSCLAATFISLARSLGRSFRENRE